MGYSWAAYGDFTMSAVARAKLEERLKPWVTAPKDFRDDQSFDDWGYSASGLRYTSVFSEPYGEKRERLIGMLAQIAEAGAEGTLVTVGFEDGGPDSGEIWAVRGGKVTAKKIATAAAAKKARAHEAYAQIVAKWEAAFPELNTKPPKPPLSRLQARAIEILESFPAAAVFEVVAAANTVVGQTKKKTTTLSEYAGSPERLMAMFRDGDAKLDEANDGAWRKGALFHYLRRLDASKALAFADEIVAAPDDAEFTWIAWGMLASLGDEAQRERAVTKAFAPSGTPDINLAQALVYATGAGARWAERLFCRWCDAPTAPEAIGKAIFMAMQRSAPAFTDRAEIESIVRAMSGPRSAMYPCLVLDRFVLPHVPALELSADTRLWLARCSMNAERLAEIRAALGIA